MDRKTFKQLAKRIILIIAGESVDDPYEQNQTFTEYVEIPVYAIVTDLTASQAQWKMYGVTSLVSAKEIVIEKGYEDTFKLTYRIKVDSEDTNYEGFRLNGRLEYRIEGDFLRAYIYSKHDE